MENYNDIKQICASVGEGVHVIFSERCDINENNQKLEETCAQPNQWLSIPQRYKKQTKWHIPFRDDLNGNRLQTKSKYQA
jgi:hypothetical protein